MPQKQDHKTTKKDQKKTYDKELIQQNLRNQAKRNALQQLKTKKTPFLTNSSVLFCNICDPPYFQTGHKFQSTYPACVAIRVSPGQGTLVPRFSPLYVSSKVDTAYQPLKEVKIIEFTQSVH